MLSEISSKKYYHVYEKHSNNDKTFIESTAIYIKSLRCDMGIDRVC